MPRSLQLKNAIVTLGILQIILQISQCAIGLVHAVLTTFCLTNNITKTVQKCALRINKIQTFYNQESFRNQSIVSQSYVIY